jgi:tRNA splicing endonuclease
MGILEATEWEAKVSFVRRHYEKKGYRVHSGLQFGCELVLYADDPARVHSDFCIHVLRAGTYFMGVAIMNIPKHFH